jgi:pre-mRNA-splicing helicase BRR2
VNVELEESEEDSDEDRVVVAGEDQEDGAERPEEQVEMVVMDDEDEGSELQPSPVKKAEEGLVLIQEVDAQWLNRALIEQFADKMAEEVLEIEAKVLKVLALENPRECEKKLFGILGVEKFEIIKLLVRNKASIYWGTLLQKAQS